MEAFAMADLGRATGRRMEAAEREPLLMKF